MATDYYVRLKAVLDAGHPTTGPYNADDVLATDEINAINLSAARPVSEPEAAIRESGKWTPYRERANALEPDGVTFTNPWINELMSAFQSRTDEINFRDPYWSSVIDNAVTEGSIGPAAGEQLKAWSDNRQSDAMRNGLGIPTVGDVTYARTLP